MSEATEELRARLAAARKRNEELQRERLARAATRKLEREVAEAERETRLREAIDDAEAEHGAEGEHIAVVHATYGNGSILGSIIVKRPAPQIWKRFRDTKSVKDADLEKLWRACLVWPDVETVERYCEELPHTPLSMVQTITTLAGVAKEELTEK